MTSPTSFSARPARPTRPSVVPVLYAAAIGLVGTLLAFIAGVALAIASGHSLHVPGVLTYEMTSQAMGLEVSSALPVTWLVLSVLVGLPLGLVIHRTGHRHG